MVRFNLKAAARLATVAALPVLSVACGHRQLADAPHDGSAAIIESVGDIGFRIDRTVANQGPAPYVLKVNDVLVGNDLSGLATRVVVKPGKVKL
ncbi:MAG: hypothetical protein REJ50_24410, partial [Bordetella sp.]|nr:hypothetical protein [Bordetella sp.]